MSNNFVESVKGRMFEEWIQNPDEVEFMIANRACMIHEMNTYLFGPGQPINECGNPLVTHVFADNIKSGRALWRGIDNLVEAGILHRTRDKEDKRRYIYYLSSQVDTQMVIQKYKKELRPKLGVTGYEGLGPRFPKRYK